MNDNEAGRIFRSLSEALRSAKLEWLLEEAIAEIRVGKPKEKKVRVAESSVFVHAPEEPEAPRGGSATFVESIEYTPQEQLEILLSALDRGVVAPIFMEDQVAATLSKALSPSAGSPRPLEFSFLPDGEGEESRSSTEDGRRPRIQFGDTLSETITRFREALHAPDQSTPH